LLVQPEPGVPLVAMRAVWRGGVRFESEADHGVSQLLARLLTRGTSRRSASEVSREIDALAGSLSGHAGRNSFGLRGEFLARQIERGFALFAECLLDPALAPEEVLRERGEQLEEVRTRDDSPGAAVFDLFSEALWKAHPYRLTGAGSAQSLGRLDAPALEDHLARRYPVSRLVLAICGDVDPEYVADAAAQAIAASRPGGEGQVEPRPQREPAPEGPREARRVAAHQQSHCVIGFRGAAVDDDDRFALDALASALGGQGGRLFVELRERRGLAYSVSAMSVEGLDPGYFAVHLATHPDKLATARDAALEELRRVARDGLPEEDLDRARRWIIGSHAIGLQKTSARAAVLAFDEAYGLGAQAHRRYPERIEALTPSHVRDVARRFIDLDRCVTAVLGPP
jgi:zinc protease